VERQVPGLKALVTAPTDRVIPGGFKERLKDTAVRPDGPHGVGIGVAK
jgi:hypothetical protein